MNEIFKIILLIFFSACPYNLIHLNNKVKTMCKLFPLSKIDFFAMNGHNYGEKLHQLHNYILILEIIVTKLNYLISPQKGITLINMLKFIPGFLECVLSENKWLQYEAPSGVGTVATKSQIVRTPLQVFYDCVGKPDWIFLSQFESIYDRDKNFKYKNLICIYIL